MRKLAIVAALSLALCGCEPTLSTLVLPREPTPESAAAPRRKLTEAEQDQISAAVEPRLKDPTHRVFRWLPLVLRPHDHVVDYCGSVNGSDVDGEYQGLSKFFAQLTFDGRGKLAKVDIKSIAKDKGDAAPSEIDSICIQDGYKF